MTRVTRNKILLPLAVVVGCALAVAIIVGTALHVPDSLRPIVFGVAAAAGLALIASDRVRVHYWQSYYRGLRLLLEGQPAAAIAEFETFRETLRRRPWVAGLIWQTLPFYSPSIEAMALCNLGVAHIGVGDLGRARERLEQARALDPLFPHPYVNLAVLAQLAGDAALATELRARACELGLRGTRVDGMIQALGRAYVRLETARTRAAGPPPDPRAN